jgi:hypothetical protein
MSEESNTEAIIRRIAALEEARSLSVQERINKLTDEINLAKNLKEVGDDLLGIDEKELEYKQKAILLEEDIKQLLEDRNNLSDALYKKKLRDLSLDKERLAVTQDTKQATEGTLKSIFGISDGATLLGERLLNPEAAMKGMADGLAKLKNPKVLFGALIFNSLQLAVAQDKAAVSFNRATGQAGTFNSQIAGLERSLYTAGVSSDEAGQAFQSLFLNMSEFTTMSKKDQTALAETTVILQELGISSEITANNLNFATKAMGMNADQAARLQRELFTFAQDLGVSAEKIATDFGQFGNEIAALGANGVDAFRGLQAAAKSLGMEMGELLDLTKQFDRFDTAAESVGRLNALLGGPFLNAVQMVSVTDPTERLRLLKQGIDNAGISFDQMDYYQRKALASATGLGEAQLAMLMNGDIDLVNEPMKSAKELRELEAQTREFNGVMEELMQIGRGLAMSFQVFIPVIKTIADGIQLLAPLIGARLMVPAIYLLGTAFAALTKTMLKNPFVLVATAVAYLAQGIYYGFSPSILVVLGLLAAAFLFLTPAALGLMPVILPLAGAFSLAAIAAIALGTAFNSIFGDGMIKNLQSMAIEIASIVASINELSTTKAMAYTATMAATTVSAGALAMTGATNTPATVEATAAASAAPAGPPPTINISLSIDGTEFQTAVNSVEATNYVNGQKSTLYDSIVNAFINNQVTTRGN